MRWILIYLLTLLLHVLLLLEGPTLPTLFQKKHPSFSSMQVMWITSLKKAPIETSQQESPLEQAQVITEDLLKASLE